MGVTRHGSQAAQHVHHVGIREYVVAELEKLAEIVHSGRNGVEEVFLSLEITTESVCSKHLKCAEKHKQAESSHEVAHARHLRILLQGIVIFGHKVATKLVAVTCRCLPEERCEVIIVRSLASSLEIYEVRIVVRVEHYVACLEVTIEERVGLLRREILGKQTEVGLKLQLMEVELGRLEEAILEVIEVEEHAVLIKLGLRITVLPVQSACAAYLNVRQLAYGAHKQLFLTLIVSASGIASTGNGVEERRRTKVALQITQSVLANGKDVRNRQLTLGKMLGKINKGMVFVTAGAHDADNREAVLPYQTIILAVASRSGYAFRGSGHFAAPRLIQFDKFFHLFLFLLGFVFLEFLKVLFLLLVQPCGVDVINHYSQYRHSRSYSKGKGDEVRAHTYYGQENQYLDIH